jgi:hypothetical protein
VSRIADRAVSTTRDPVLAQLRALEQRVRELERRLSRQDEDDQAFLRVLLAAIGLDVAFSAHDLYRHRRVDPALDAVLTPYPTVRVLGAKLRALAKTSRGGLGVRRVAKDATGTIWVLTVSGNSHDEACARSGSGHEMRHA